MHYYRAGPLVYLALLALLALLACGCRIRWERFQKSDGAMNVKAVSGWNDRQSSVAGLLLCLRPDIIMRTAVQQQV